MSVSKIQHPDISHYAELDFFEAGNYPGVRDDGLLGTIHDWQNDMSIDYWNSNNTQETYTDWSQWHVVGVLWAPGIVTWYLDGKPLMIQQYGSDKQPFPLAGTVTGISPTPPGTFSDLDVDPLGQQIVVGSDPNWPMQIDWVRVWHN
jgi:beta-glucanase (GH16 family)